MTDLQGDEGRISRSLYEALQEGHQGKPTCFSLLTESEKGVQW
jgi:hypothetical protein